VDAPPGSRGPRPGGGTGVHDPRSWPAGIPPLVDTTGSGALRARRRRRCRWCRGGVGSSIAGAHEGCHRSRRGGRCRSRRICGSTAAGVRGGWWLQYAPSAAIRAAFAVTERSRRGGFRSVGAEPQERATARRRPGHRPRGTPHPRRRTRRRHRGPGRGAPRPGRLPDRHTLRARDTTLEEERAQRRGLVEDHPTELAARDAALAAGRTEQGLTS
jgi:hypothetical protein